MRHASIIHPLPCASRLSALALANYGLAVLPLHPAANGLCTCQAGEACKSPGKHPVWAKWQERATTSVAHIERDWPDNIDTGIGIHLGKSDLIVLDIDPRNGGAESIIALEATINTRLDDSAAVVVETGGGGHHYYFSFYEGMTDQLDLLRRHLSRDFPGIDLLYGAHYVVAPPSLHRSGKRYGYRDKPEWQWMDGMPDVLLALPDAMRRERSVDRDCGIEIDVFAHDNTTDIETPENINRVCSALECLAADCPRDKWLTVLFAMHSTAWKCAERLFKEWSLTAPNRFNMVEFTRDWSSAKVARPKAITLGTLFYLAKQNGWTDPRVLTFSSPETYGDISNGRRSAMKHRGRFLYCRATHDWYHWDRLHWCKGGADAAMQAAKIVADEILTESLDALRANPTEANKRAHSQALGVHRTARRLEAMLAMAATEPGMGIASPAEFDNDQWLLGVQNGVINLRTGELMAPNSTFRVSKLAGANFVFGAECPRWLEFLEAVFERDTTKIDFVQRLVGYCLTGCVNEEKLFFLHGSGRNGKSVFRTVLAALLSDYAETVGSALLTKGGGSEGERYVSRLVGARLATANEVGVNDVWDDERLKQITSRDTIPTRQLYGEAYSFQPTHKLLICGNHQPGSHDAGDGMWRRLILIPFKRQFTDAEVIPDLDQQLIRSELSGILAWAIQGCLIWQREGLGIPVSISAMTDTYRRETDLLGLFLEEHTCEKVGAETSSSMLYTYFRLFCDEQGVRPPSNIAFGRQLSGRGIPIRRSNGQRYYQGVALLRGVGDEL